MDSYPLRRVRRENKTQSESHKTKGRHVDPPLCFLLSIISRKAEILRRGLRRNLAERARGRDRRNFIG